MIKEIRSVLKSIIEKYPLLLFYLITILIAGFYYYHIILFSPPQSVHRWRQTDSASITLNMYQHGMKFFQPEVHSLTSDDSTTGYAGAEAPILYYLIAFLYKIFGPHDYIYRIVNTCIFLLGLGALFRIGIHYLHDFVPAAFLSLLVFVSPVVAYYGNNFLTDTTALSLVFIGWWQYIRYIDSKRYITFLYAVALFTMAGLLKATMLLNLFALGGLWLLLHFRLFRAESQQIFPQRTATFTPLFIGLAIVLMWYLHIIRFNQLHESKTFLTSIVPWWQLTPQQRHELTRNILMNNLHLYYSCGVLCFLGLSLLFVIRYFKIVPKFLGIITLLLLTGSALYVNLYYVQFQYHDYYLLLLFSPVAMLVLLSLVIIRSKLPRLFSSWYFKIAIVVFMIFNVSHARSEMNLRYFGGKRETPLFESHYTIQPYLRSIGIKPEDRVISMPDYTNCYTLYLMNQPGNNLGDIGPHTAESIEYFIDRGAQYLVINDTSILHDPRIQDFVRLKAGEYKEVQIFRLK